MFIDWQYRCVEAGAGAGESGSGAAGITPYVSDAAGPIGEYMWFAY